MLTEQKGMTCEVSKGKARLQLPVGGSPRPNVPAYRELLHLVRYFADCTPKLVNCDDDHEFEDDADAPPATACPPRQPDRAAVHRVTQAGTEAANFRHRAGKCWLSTTFPSSSSKLSVFWRRYPWKRES